MLLESSCSEVENQKDEVHLPRERFSFFEIWTVQPSSDSCLAEAIGQGWTVQIEENGNSLKVNELSLRDSPLQMQLLSSSMDLFFMLFKQLNA